MKMEGKKKRNIISTLSHAQKMIIMYHEYMINCLQRAMAYVQKKGIAAHKYTTQLRNRYEQPLICTNVGQNNYFCTINYISGFLLGRRIVFRKSLKSPYKAKCVDLNSALLIHAKYCLLSKLAAGAASVAYGPSGLRATLRAHPGCQRPPELKKRIQRRKKKLLFHFIKD